MRYGILDSAPDIDVLILAKELDAAVVASDFGIQKWAEELGVRFVPAHTFPMILKEYLAHVENGDRQIKDFFRKNLSDVVKTENSCTNQERYQSYEHRCFEEL